VINNLRRALAAAGLASAALLAPYAPAHAFTQDPEQYRVAAASTLLSNEIELRCFPERGLDCPPEMYCGRPLIYPPVGGTCRIEEPPDGPGREPDGHR
jgi:hypothetical protein